MTDKLHITCPHCRSALKIDTEAGVVVEHSPPARATEKTDFDTRLKQLENEKHRAADVMAEAMRKEKSKDRLMEDRFRELLDDAKKKDDGSKPIKDIDLD
jgi:hypothetical protein